MLSEEMLNNVARESGLFKYKNNKGDFVIPFKKAEGRLLSGMLALLRNGWAMQVRSHGVDMYYILFKYDSCRQLDSCSEVYRGMLDEMEIPYFSKINMVNYSNNMNYAWAIDCVLLYARDKVNIINGWSIAVVVNDRSEFEFVEVRGF